MASCLDCIHFNPCNMVGNIIIEKPEGANEWVVHNNVGNNCKYYLSITDCMAMYRGKESHLKQVEKVADIFDEILRHIAPLEQAEDYHGRQAFERGDTTERQIHQYAEHILGSISDYVTELAVKYIVERKETSSNEKVY